MAKDPAHDHLLALYKMNGNNWDRVCPFCGELALAKTLPYRSGYDGVHQALWSHVDHTCPKSYIPTEVLCEDDVEAPAPPRAVKAVLPKGSVGAVLPRASSSR